MDNGCFVYALEYERQTKRGTNHYIGITNNPLRRWYEHATGIDGARATRLLGFSRVVCVLHYPTRSQAMREERRAWERIYRKWIPSEDLVNCSFIEPKVLRQLRKRDGRFVLGAQLRNTILYGES